MVDLALLLASEHLIYCVFPIGQFIFQSQRSQAGLAAVEAAGREAVRASGCHHALQSPETTHTGSRQGIRHRQQATSVSVQCATLLYFKKINK